jgi:hypothetical protein
LEGSKKASLEGIAEGQQEEVAQAGVTEKEGKLLSRYECFLEVELPRHAEDLDVSVLEREG